MKFAASLVLAIALGGCATLPAAPPAPVEVAIIGLNDFHGNLEPPHRAIPVGDGAGQTVQVPAGGAAYLANVVDAIRARHANSITVSAGDMISASPLASALFLDEPAIHAMNAIGVELNALGNHEFDRGRAELLRIQNGGCDKHTLRTPCALEPFGGAKFRELGANTLTEDGTPLFPGTALKTFGSGKRAVTIGFVGLTTRTAGSLVSPDGIAGLTFADEAATINAAVPPLRAAGADAIVVLIHEGGATTVGYNDKSCAGLSGAIVPIIEQLTVAVDVIVSGHTHQAYVCDLGPGDTMKPLLTSAGYGGTLATEIVLAIDPVAGRVVSRRADNLIVQGEGYEGSRGAVPLSDLVPHYPARADVAVITARYVAAARDVAARPVGRLGGAAEKAMEAAGPRLIADAQLAATRGAGAEIAFMNPFGVRADIVPAADGSVTYGQIFAAQPFGNTLVTMTLTGAQLKALLEQSPASRDNGQLLAPSAGFAYRYDFDAPEGARVSGITLDGVPVGAARGYRVTVNSFLASGGDGYTILREGSDRVVGMNDLDAFELWLRGTAPRAVPSEARILTTP